MNVLFDCAHVWQDRVLRHVLDWAIVAIDMATFFADKLI